MSETMSQMSSFNKIEKNPTLEESLSEAYSEMERTAKDGPTLESFMNRGVKQPVTPLDLSVANIKALHYAAEVNHKKAIERGDYSVEVVSAKCEAAMKAGVNVADFFAELYQLSPEAAKQYKSHLQNLINSIDVANDGRYSVAA